MNELWQFNKLGVDSYAWFIILLLFGGLGFFLDKFKKGMFYVSLIAGIICASFAVLLLK